MSRVTSKRSLMIQMLRIMSREERSRRVGPFRDVGAMSLADLPFYFCYHTLCNLSERRHIEVPDGRTYYMQLQCRLLFVLVLMNCTKITALDGLESGVLPVAPLTTTFVMTTASGKPTSIL